MLCHLLHVYGHVTLRQDTPPVERLVGCSLHHGRGCLLGHWRLEGLHLPHPGTDACDRAQAWRLSQKLTRHSPGKRPSICHSPALQSQLQHGILPSRQPTVTHHRQEIQLHACAAPAQAVPC